MQDKPTAMLSFGLIGLMSCAIVWFGVTHPWYAFQRERWESLNEERRRAIRRGLAWGLLAMEAFLIAAGAAVGK